MKKYLISVIIPTRNRQVYAEFAVRQILSLNQNIEIIINDNSDNDCLGQAIKDLVNRDDVVYTYIKERISAVDNYNLATEKANGEFLIAIGDDDGLLHNISECAHWMKKNNLDVVKPSKRLRYYWPDDSDKNVAIRKGLVSAGPFCNDCYLVDLEEEIHRLLYQGGQHYLELDLGGSYHGLIRMSRMREVLERTGRYFGGCSPDMYSAACLSLLPNMRFAVIGYPISLPGICKESTSADSRKGRHVGSFETAPQFIGMKERYKWDNRVPRLYSVETIWAECFHKAVIAMGKEDLLNEFNYRKLYEEIYINNRTVRYELFLNINEEEKKNLLQAQRKMKTDRWVAEFKKILKMGIARLTGARYRKTPCPNIQSAEEIVSNFIFSKKNRDSWRAIMQTEL